MGDLSQLPYPNLEQHLMLTWASIRIYTGHVPSVDVAQALDPDAEDGDAVTANLLALVGPAPELLADLLTDEAVPEFCKHHYVHVLHADVVYPPYWNDLAGQANRILQAESDADQQTEAGAVLVRLLGRLRLTGLISP